jgi:maltose O-acetyltransferase
MYGILYRLVLGSVGRETIFMGWQRIYGNPKDISIGKHSRLHDGVMLNTYMGKIKIGNNVVLSPDAKLIIPSLTLNKRYEDRTHIGKNIILEDDVWIATNATVIGGVTVGKGSIIATGSVVTKNIPPYVLAGGIPARIIKVLED